MAWICLSVVQIVDEQGNLFGVVNVIDALVVLMIVAVGVAGIALVVGDEPEPEPESEPEVISKATAIVTLDLGSHPTFVVREINEGDTYSPDDRSNLTVTDVHVTPQESNPRVIVQARVTGEVRQEEDVIDYSGAPLRLGRSLVIETNRYKMSGQITDVGDKDTLDRQQTSILLRTTLPAVESEAISAGDEIQIADRTVATVEQISAYGASNVTHQIVFLNVALETHRRQGTQHFGGAPVRSRETVLLTNDEYSIDTSIERIGTDLDQQNVGVVVTSTVDAETASRISEGDFSQAAGETTATVESVSVFGTEDPDQKRVITGLSLTTVGYGERPQFGSVFVRRGANLTFREENYEITGTIDRVGATEPRGSQVSQTATLRVNGLQEDIANAIQPDLVERTNGKTIARISSVKREPSALILRGDKGDPEAFNERTSKDVTITAELQMRETTDGLQFKGRGVRRGHTVTLDLGTVTIDAVVVNIE